MMATMMRSEIKPAMPITIMPQITNSVRDKVRPSMITAPSPCGTPVISPTTITNKAQAQPKTGENGRQRCRQHDAEELRSAGTTKHGCRFE